MNVNCPRLQMKEMPIKQFFKILQVKISLIPFCALYSEQSPKENNPDAIHSCAVYTPNIGPGEI